MALFAGLVLSLACRSTQPEVPPSEGVVADTPDLPKDDDGIDAALVEAGLTDAERARNQRFRDLRQTRFGTSTPVEAGARIGAGPDDGDAAEPGND